MSIKSAEERENIGAISRSFFQSRHLQLLRLWHLNLNKNWNCKLGRRQVRASMTIRSIVCNDRFAYFINFDLDLHKWVAGSYLEHCLRERSVVKCIPLPNAFYICWIERLYLPFHPRTLRGFAIDFRGATRRFLLELLDRNVLRRCCAFRLAIRFFSEKVRATVTERSLSS